MIKHIIFDLGQVLIGFDAKSYLQNFNLSEYQVNQILIECFQTGLWDELDRGTYTYQETADIIGQKRPELNDIIHLVLGKNIYHIFTELHAGTKFLQNCIKRGYSCYYLTNFGEEGFRYVNQVFDFFKLFSGGTASYELHSIKPEPEIYHYLLNKYQLNATECIFIDDNYKNVQAANAIGFHSILCKNHNEMKQEFEQLITAIP